MKSAEYWEQTALLREIAIQEGATTTAEEILKLYVEALSDIEKEIEKIKFNFQKRFGIDNETAEYFLTQAQEDANTARLLKALEQAPTQKAREDILEYIRRDGLSARAYSARRERYRAVEKEIYARVKEIYADAVPKLENALAEAYKASYYGLIEDTAEGLNAGINFSILNDDAVNAAINTKWHGERFSERIWKNTDKLAQEAQNLVTKALMSGEAGVKTAAKLAERFGVAEFRATTLVRTETAHAHAEADFKAYEDLEIKRYKYLATLDYRTCEICQPLDGMSFDVAERAEGVNSPVMHPRCRCTTTADMGYDWTARRARDPITGRSSVIDGNITYAEWKESLTAEQKAALELSRKKDSRKTADKLQHVQYQKVLGRKVVPQSFDKFRDLKYNDKERWGEIKLEYRRQNKEKKAVDFGGKSGIIENRRYVNTNGYRNEKPLSSEQIRENMQYAQRLGIPRDRTRYGEHYTTSYGAMFDVLYIGTDVYPAEGKHLSANSRISNKGAIAHELVGHREAQIQGLTQENNLFEEIQASIRAARFAPELTDRERFVLLRDAAERAQKNGIRLRDIKNKLHIQRR